MARLASSRLALLAASAAAAASSGAASSAAPPAQVFTLHLLDAAAFPMAQCLDGSVGGFYFQPGSGSGATQWMVHTQGGGWCTSDADCLGRAGSALGSSATWSRGTVTCPDSKAPVCYADGGAQGMLSNDPAVNPAAYNWNKVFLNYCDGGSYAGSVVAPVSVSGKQIYYRGRYILDAVYATLSSQLGLGSATRLVVKGCSAGGLAVYLHADYIASLMRTIAPGATVLAAPGAGLFLDVPGFDGQYHYRSNYEWVFSAMNVSGSVNSACIAATPPAEAARCYNAAYTIPFISTPLFVSNSLADAWQAGNVMALPCNPGSCGDKGKEAAVEAYLATFRSQMISALAPVVGRRDSGGFLQSCFVHVVEDVGAFATVKIANTTQSQAFAAWLLQSGDDARLRIDGLWSTNPTC